MSIVATIVNAIIAGDSVESLTTQLSDKWVSLTEEDKLAYNHLLFELVGVKIKSLVEDNEDEEDSYGSYQEDESYQESY